MNPRLASSKSARSENGSDFRNTSLAARVAGSASRDWADAGDEFSAKQPTAANKINVLTRRFIARFPPRFLLFYVGRTHPIFAPWRRIHKIPKNPAKPQNPRRQVPRH